MSNKKIESPCKKKCKLSTLKTYCVSCYRTINEIQRWNEYSDESKLKIINNLEFRKNKELSVVPRGVYCYSFKSKNGEIDDGEFAMCPFWGLNLTMESQSNGFCVLTGDCDWHDGSLGLLWDMCKSCGINDDID